MDHDYYWEVVGPIPEPMRPAKVILSLKIFPELVLSFKKWCSTAKVSPTIDASLHCNKLVVSNTSAQTTSSASLRVITLQP